MVFTGPSSSATSAVERLGDQDADPHQRQAFGGQHLQGRLVRHGVVGLACSHQLGRRVGIGRRDQLDVEPVLGEEAALLGDHQGGVVGIDEPVEQQADLVLRRGGQRQARERERRASAGSEYASSFSLRIARVRAGAPAQSVA